MHIAWNKGVGLAGMYQQLSRKDWTELSESTCMSSQPSCDPKGRQIVTD